MLNIMGWTFRGMNINQLIVWFFIYSFLGWCMECIVIRKQLGYWENRGFAKMPFCVIYGFGTMIAYIIFQPIEHNYVALYFAGCICATAFEFITAQIMLKLFGEVWWNYDHLRFNYKGIICLQSTLGWGLVAIVVFGFANRIVEGIVFALDSRVTLCVSTVLLVSYLCDFTYHFIKNYDGKVDFSVVVSKTQNVIKRFRR